MKFIHTADWHLGKIVHGVSMTEDQRYVLQQFVEIVRSEKPDAVLIAGDVYDRAVPPTDAIALFDEILKTIVMELNIPVLAIAGNHDSPNRLHFGSHLMRANGFHVVGRYTATDEPVILHDAFGAVHFYLVPYVDPSIVRQQLENEAITTHQEAMQAIIEKIEQQLCPDARHVFVGHAFVTPSGAVEPNTSESERPLAIGGVEHVSAQLFKPFHYTALGHLHKGHYVLQESIRYAGSPLKYSISEEQHQKGCYIVELDENGEVTVEKRRLQPRRDVRHVVGTLEELMTHPINDDYVFVQLLDQLNVLHPMEKIRSVYPNAMHIERQAVLPNQVKKERRIERQKQDDVALFRAFYEQLTGDLVQEELETIFQQALFSVQEKGASS